MKPWQEEAARYQCEAAKRTRVTAFDPTLKCPDCGGRMALRVGKWGRFYACVNFPECKGRHGAHPNGAPKGIPGDADTRAARAETMRALEAISEGKKTPAEVESMLREVATLSGIQRPFRIGRRDAECCRRITEAARHVQESRRPKTAYDWLKRALQRTGM